MNKVPNEISTREGPVYGESLGAPDSQCIGPNVYGRANRHLMGIGNSMGVMEGNVQGGFVEVMEEEGNQEKVIETVEKNNGETTSLKPKEPMKVAIPSDYSLMIVDSRSRSGSESSAAVSDTARLWQSVKRPRLYEEVPITTDDEMSETSKPRSRVRSPTTGRCVGKARAKADMARKKREEVSKKAEEELLRDSLKAQYRQERLLTESSGSRLELATQKTVAEIQNKVGENVAAITMVATKSGHLKGTFVRALKDAAVSITEAVEVLSSRTITDETRQLQADNVRLQGEMASLRKELSDLKLEMEMMRKQGSVPTTPRDVTEELPPVSLPSKNKGKNRPSEVNSDRSSMEEICRSVMVQVGEMMNARLASFEDRLLPEKNIRPPLAADKRKTAQADEFANATPNQTPGTNQSAKKSCAKGETHPAPPSSTSVQPDPNKESWEKVGKRKKKKRKEKTGVQRNATQSQSQSQPKPQSQAQPRPDLSKKARQLRPPRSAAVVITLQPGAKEKGASYASVLEMAKKRIALAELGINSVRFKVAATGGRILEFSGASGDKMADCFAEKLKEVVNEECVKVSRPTKCVDMRVSGLDDSVTSGDVVTAVANVGGCLGSQVRAGEVTRNYSGLGTVWLRCPVAAAKKVVTGGRLLVGWVSASIKLLEERPQRCYRCLQRGHLRAQCMADTDRSDTCYRCGQVGHKAKGCSAAPHCSVCAAAGRVANHRVDSSACSQPRKPRKKNSGNTDDGPRVSSQSADPSTSAQAEEVPMAVG